MVVRVPDAPEVTSRPLTVSLPLVAAAAGRAVAAEIDSVIPAASRAPVTRNFMLFPRSLKPPARLRPSRRIRRHAPRTSLSGVPH
jgi:hypothetical protein